MIPGGCDLRGMNLRHTSVLWPHISHAWTEQAHVMLRRARQRLHTV